MVILLELEEVKQHALVWALASVGQEPWVTHQTMGELGPKDWRELGATQELVVHSGTNVYGEHCEGRRTWIKKCR